MFSVRLCSGKLVMKLIHQDYGIQVHRIVQLVQKQRLLKGLALVNSLNHFLEILNANEVLLAFFEHRQIQRKVTCVFRIPILNHLFYMVLFVILLFLLPNDLHHHIHLVPEKCIELVKYILV